MRVKPHRALRHSQKNTKLSLNQAINEWIKFDLEIEIKAKRFNFQPVWSFNILESKHAMLTTKFQVNGINLFLHSLTDSDIFFLQIPAGRNVLCSNRSKHHLMGERDFFLKNLFFFC